MGNIVIIAHADSDTVARVEDDATLGDYGTVGIILTEVRRKRQGNLRRIDEVAYRVLDGDSRRLDRANNRLVVLHRVVGDGTFHDEYAKKMDENLVIGK